MLMPRIYKQWLRRIVSVVILLLFAFAILKNWSRIIDSLDELNGLSIPVVLATMALMSLTFLLAALSYSLLSFRRLSLGELLIVEMAAAFINRIMPSGIGGLGAHGLYLHKRKHTAAEATAVVSANNLLGMSVHVLLLTLILVAGRNFVFFNPGWSAIRGWTSLGIVIIALGAASLPPVRKKVIGFGRNLIVSLRGYQRQPHQVFFAAIALAGLTLTNLLIFTTVSWALGIGIDVTTLFIIYSVGVLVGTAVPTPGGLAGVEAGLVVGLMSYGTSSELAIAATLAFRLITYWFPLVPGAFALLLARKRHLF